MHKPPGRRKQRFHLPQDKISEDKAFKKGFVLRKGFVLGAFCRSVLSEFSAAAVVGDAAGGDVRAVVAAAVIVVLGTLAAIQVTVEE